MTVALLRTRQQAPVGRGFAAEALVRIGMPQLALHGLSENWLLKELGDRHWMLIAELAGIDRPRFLDRSGATIYAAFCGVSIGEARFESVGENDDLLIRSEIARVSATQFASRHVLLCRGGPVGRVELSSVFVGRKVPGRNRSIARTGVEGLPPMPAKPGFAAITGLARELRAGVRSEHYGFRLHGAEALGRFAIDPCPSLDFNGAGFLYFTSIQAYADRVEWGLFDRKHPDLVTAARDIVFFGNADVGEPIMIELLDSRETEDGLDHHCRVLAAGRLVAEVFSRRRRSRPAAALDT